MGREANWFEQQMERVFEARRDPSRRVWFLPALWVVGCAALGIISAICSALNTRASITSFAFLLIIVPLSLLDSFVSSAIFSVVSVGLLDYYFIEPLYSFDVTSASDIVMLAGFLVTTFSVTWLVRRTHRLSEERGQQARLLDLTHDAILVRDPENSLITYWNRGAEAFYGWRRDEAIGKPAHVLLQTEFPESLDAVLVAVREKGYWEGEVRRKKRDGTPVIVLSRWSQQLDAQNQLVGILEITTDITARKDAEAALQRSQAAYLAEAQRLSSTGSFGWTIATGALEWSEETFRIFGYDPSLTPSLALVMERVHPDDAASVHDVLERAAREGQDFDFEHRLLLPNGVVRHVHVVAHAMTNGHQPLQFVGALMDVTATRRAEDRLATAQTELAHVSRVSMLGQLTASIGHEVSQPLTAIMTNGEAGLRWLNRATPDLDEARGTLRRMIADSRRASEVVQRMRALVRRTAVEMAALDINQVVSEVVPLVRREVTEQKVALGLELAQDLPNIRGDRVQLQQVVMNLMINGIQAMGAVNGNGRARDLAVRSLKDGEWIVVSVRDSGIGIDPAIAEQLFEAFATTKRDGMGMGLSICRTIIEAHGGRIWASGNEGPGATFQFALPVGQQSQGSR